MPENKSSKNKKRLNLDIEPPSKREIEANQSVFGRLLGIQIPDIAPKENESEDKTVIHKQRIVAPTPKLAKPFPSENISDNRQANISTQEETTTQANISTVVNFASGARQFATQEETTTQANISTQANSTAQLIIEEVRGELRIPNTIFDSLLPRLDPAAALVYLRLYRLSHGYHKATCTVGREKLALALNMSGRTVFTALTKLEKLGLIERLGAQFGGNERGNTLKVNLPSTSANSSRLANISTQANSSTGENTADIKRHDHDHDSIKKNHHQSARKESQETGEFENWMMTKYETLTGNQWTKLDRTVLSEIGDDVQEINRTDLDEMMLSIAQRASAPIGSFKFFAIALQNELAEKPFLSQKHLRERYAACAKELYRIFVGKKWESESEKIYEFKRIVLKQMLPWKDDLANETFAA
jgi:DNA-binding Lrp family transcriptional regulator